MDSEHKIDKISLGKRTKNVEESIGIANLESVKRSKRKQTFGVNNLPEIDCYEIRGNVPTIDHPCQNANTRPAKCSKRKQTFGVSNLSEIDCNEIRESVPMINQPCRNANARPGKCVKRKQRFGVNSRSEIDFNEIGESLPTVNQPCENVNTRLTKRSNHKQSFGTNHLPEIDDNKISESIPMENQPCFPCTYDRRIQNSSAESARCSKSKQAENFEVGHGEPAVLIQYNAANSKNVTPTRTIVNVQTEVAAKKNSTNRYGSSKCKKRLNNEVFTLEELAGLRKAGIPQPVSPEQLASITEAIHEDYHSEIVVCAVCDEMFSKSETKLLSANDLPSSFFSVLRKPSGSPNEVLSLHPLLLQQYDVSHHFPADPRFQGLLISPRGLEIHRKNCLVKNQNCCESQLYICVNNGCLTALQHKKIPKFAIAHGNYIGQLPQEIREMTFASRSLIRPVTSFGRMACYSDTSGTRLTGHVYSNRLNTALVRQKLPMAPANTAIRVLIVSPMASDQSAVSRAKMASMKSDYVIEPEKIASSLRFFRDVGNKVMKNVEIDQDAINNLPSDKTSVDMLFTTEKETEDSHQDLDLVQSTEYDNVTGGPSLSRSNEEFLDGVFESATVTIGAGEPEDINDHGKIARVLHTILDGDTSPNEVTSKDDLGTNNSSSTYVVRPEKEFMLDSNPDYLELHYPDLFPFGCGGFGEQRKNPISRKALVQHLLNLSSRQFQQVDFVLPIYDMVTRQQVSNMAYVRSILPSRLSGPEQGTNNSKGEVYGRVSMEDLRAVHDYKVTCAEAASQGCRFPLPPASLNGLAIDFFTAIGICTTPMQHSQAAASRNRQKVYAAHNSLGKAQIWFTVSPDDTQSFKIVWYALGSQAASYENPVPGGEFRFKLLAKHPVAAALHFQRVLKIVIKRVVGWNRSQLLPYRSGGVFGVPKGYLYLVEEQSRLTLHAHFLIWLYGHDNIERQLLLASQLDDEERKSNDVSHNEHELFQRTVGANEEDHLTHVAKVLQLLTKNIESFSSGEIRLPETEMTQITKCPVYNCNGELELASSIAQDILRSRPKNIDSEPHGLKCPICQVTYTVTSRIDAALQSGYRRCFGKEQLTKKEVIDLIWLGMPLQPNVEDVNSFDRWLLNFASIQVLVNMHDWKHRSSCFKNGRLFCRYNTPHDIVQETNVTPAYAKSANPTEDEDLTLSASKKIVYLKISLKKRAVFMFMTDCNPAVMAVLGCNNCTRYVENQKISLYYGAYASKYSSENGKALAELMRSLNAYEERRLLKEQQEANEIEKEADLHVVSDNNPARSDASIGFGRLMSGARAATNGETVGAPVAAFCALGNNLFEMSHETAILPLTQARAFVQGEQLTASINKYGTVFATIHDYVYRSSTDPTIDGMNYWQFVTSLETCKLKSYFQDVEETDMENTECVQRGRLQHRFQQDHPRFETHGLWERTHLHWPQYTAQRLPDLLDLHDDSEVSADERTSKRERYAEDVLIMFFPFRKLIDIFDVDSTWWLSYLKRKPLLDTNENTVETLGNIQNYYESFCRKNCLPEDHPFCQGDPIPAVPKDDNTDDIVNLMNVDGDLNTASAQDAAANNATDPFVRLLTTFTENPVRLKLVSGYVSVTPEQARLAINVLPKSNSNKKTTFSLPGRSQVGPLVEDPRADVINGKVCLDVPVGTRIELLEHIEEALSNRTTHPSPITAHQPEKLEPNFPTLQQHSQHWGLNEKQHLAFVLISAALLQHVALANSSSTGNPSIRMALLTSNIEVLVKKIIPTSQLMLFLGGSGGTGKSRVIQAFVDFARRWHSTASVVVCASSGVAAVLIGGCTLHSALGISARLVDSEPSSDQIIAWSEISLLILDEFSMIQPALFDFLKRRLEKLKGNSKPYGAIHLVLVGDFFQLPPVGVTIYKLPTQREDNLDEHSLASMRARVAWKECLTDVIELTENLRQTDTRWSESQKRWRVNQPTKQDIDDVNGRFMNPTSTSALLPPLGTVIAVPENKSREEALKFCEKTMQSSLAPVQPNSIDWRNRGALLIEASVSKSTGHQTVDPKQEKYIRSLGSKRLKAPGQLCCFIGAPYMITTNTDVSKGVANGTNATLEDICLRDSATIRVTKLDDGSFTHAVYAEDVLCLVFKHTASGWSEVSLYPGLEKGCFPIISSKNGVKCRLGTSATFQVQVTQFPCVLSVVLTGHKVQGKTLGAIILGYLSKHHLHGTSGWIYVILSRVRKLSDFYTLTRLDTDVRKYKPRIHVIREMKRLLAIEKVTIQRLQTVFNKLV